MSSGSENGSHPTKGKILNQENTAIVADPLRCHHIETYISPAR